MNKNQKRFMIIGCIINTIIIVLSISISHKLTELKNATSELLDTTVQTTERITSILHMSNIYFNEELYNKYYHNDAKNLYLIEVFKEYKFILNEPEEPDEPEEVDLYENMVYIGDYKITGYDPWCKHCCSKTDGITASGEEAVVGKTIAMKGYDFGTEVYIEGYGIYTVQDTGNFQSNTIDIACNSHSECYDITNLTGTPVYLVNNEKENEK